MSANIFVLMLAMIVPLFSADYSLMRAYQQLLIVLCLPAVIGSYISFSVFIKKYAFHFTTLFFVLYFYCFHLFCRNWPDRDMLKCI